MGANLKMALIGKAAFRQQPLLMFFVISLILVACRPSPGTEKSEETSSPQAKITPTDESSEINSPSSPPLSDPTAVPDATAAAKDGNQREEENSPVTPEPFPSDSDDEQALYLETALAFVPADVSHFAFTHWSRIKEHYRVPYLTSEYDLGEKDWFTKRALMENQVAAMMDHDFLEQSEDWGWDHHDLLWEALGDYGLLTTNIRVQKLRANFDYDALVELLRERGFFESPYRDVPIFSVPLTEKTDWHSTSPLEIHNIAFFPSDNLLILSPFPEGVKKVIDISQGAAPSLGESPVVKRILFKLLGTFATELYQGSDTCERFGPAKFDLSRNIESASSQLDRWPAQTFELMAAGHFIVSDVQEDVVLFYYDNHRLAESDFENRENLFRFGTSPQKPGVAYSAQFILEEFELDDALMTFRLSPSPTLRDSYGWPQTIIGWIQDGDALFASCKAESFLGIDEIQ